MRELPHGLQLLWCRPVSIVYMSIGDFLRHRGIEETQSVVLHNADECYEAMKSAPGVNCRTTDAPSMLCSRQPRPTMISSPGSGVQRTCLYMQHALLNASPECATCWNATTA